MDSSDFVQDLIPQIKEALEYNARKFFDILKKDEHGKYVQLNENKIPFLMDEAELYINYLKDIIIPNADNGSPRIDRFKLASASVRSIMSAQIFEVDVDEIYKDASSKNGTAFYVLRPNESFAYTFCEYIIRRFEKQTKVKAFSLDKTHKFKYPSQLIHFTEDGKLEQFNFQQLFMEFLNYYCNLRTDIHHLPMLAFADMLNILDMASDCYQSDDLREYYYKGV